MSLINQVLHDLDRRHRGGAVDQVLHDLLPAEVSAADAPWLRLLPWCLLVVALLALALLWASDRAPAPHTREIPLALPSVRPPPVADASVVASSADAPMQVASAATAATPSPVAPSVVAQEIAPAPQPDTAPATPSLLATPPAAPDARAEARAALLAAERDWRPAVEDTTLPAPVADAVAPLASDAAPAEESLGEMHITPSAAQAEDAATRSLARAEQAIARGDVEDGLARLRAQVLAAPTDTTMRERYVRHLLAAGRSAVAEAELRAGLAAAPRAPRLAQTLAHLLFDRGDAAGALATLLPAAPPVASDPAYHAFIAALEQHAGDHVAAAAAWRGVLEVSPNDGRAWIGLAISLAAQDERQAARSAFAQARAAGSLSAAMDAYAAAETARLGTQP
ncbi:MAG: tetratricopeptide repeat protein [Gammaproteobacteria bacterium]